MRPEKPVKADFMAQLNVVMEYYADWYSHVIKGVFYPGSENARVLKPGRFKEWLETAEEFSLLESSVLDRLKNLNAELRAESTKMLAEAQKKVMPEREAFEHFQALYTDLMNRIRVLENDSQLEDSGIDAETGLRSMSVFERDMTREMERRARSTVPLSLAVLRLDHLKDIENAGGESLSMAVKGAAQAILECVRTFDDPYRQSKGTFVICLKNTNISGANAAMGRINKQLDKISATYMANGKEQIVTLSSTIKELLPGENLEDIFTNMIKDLENGQIEAGSVLQFQELSQLQRYVKSMEGH